MTTDTTTDIDIAAEEAELQRLLDRKRARARDVQLAAIAAQNEALRIREERRVALEEERRADHDARVRRAEAALAVPVTADVDLIAHLREVAAALKAMPRSEFGRTHANSQPNAHLRDPEQILFRKLAARSNRLAVVARAAGYDVDEIMLALGFSGRKQWPALFQSGRAAGPVESDPEFAEFIEAVRPPAAGVVA